MEKEKSICKCIRCREVKGKSFSWDDAEIFVRTYRASGGLEHFISVEHVTDHVLYGFIRLRYNDPTNKKRLNCLNNCALIRELHVYGLALPLDDSKSNTEMIESYQHQGFGRKLLAWAEEMAIKDGFNKIAVISGVGVREYYRKFGYELIDGYMVKYLSK